MNGKRWERECEIERKKERDKDQHKQKKVRWKESYYISKDKFEILYFTLIFPLSLGAGQKYPFLTRNNTLGVAHVII